MYENEERTMITDIQADFYSGHRSVNSFGALNKNDQQIFKWLAEMNIFFFKKFLPFEKLTRQHPIFKNVLGIVHQCEWILN